MIGTEIVICTHCYERLSQCGELALNTWLKICCYYGKEGNPSCYKEEDRQALIILRYLENKGYVTTIEHNNKILAKPNGARLFSEEHYFFCIDHEKHARE